eukprot:20793-Eustigmatos_ZCMA.PRE.1
MATHVPRCNSRTSGPPRRSATPAHVWAQARVPRGTACGVCWRRGAAAAHRSSTWTRWWERGSQ